MIVILMDHLVRQLLEVENGVWLDENFEKKLAYVNDDNAFMRPENYFKVLQN